jgi:fatty acid desaturase
MAVVTEKILSGPELRSLSLRSDWRGALRLGIHLAMLLASGWLVAISGPWTLVPAMLVLGLVQIALFAPIHETMHMTAFLSRRANTIVGWLVSCPSLLNWHFYQAFHLAHHRHTQDPELDPELAVLPPSSLDAYIWRVLALPYWQTRFRVIWDAWRDDMSAYTYVGPRVADRIIRSLRMMSVFVVACALLSVALVGWWAPLMFWVGPQLLAQPFLRLYLLTEHTLCTMDDNGLTNTRTTVTNWVMRLVMWNMPFHTEHHLYPSIPFHRLPDAHAVIRSRLGVLQDGYARWHIGFVRMLRS